MPEGAFSLNVDPLLVTLMANELRTRSIPGDGTTARIEIPQMFATEGVSA